MPDENTGEMDPSDPNFGRGGTYVYDGTTFTLQVRTYDPAECDANCKATSCYEGCPGQS